MQDFADLVHQHRALIAKVARAYCRNAEDRNDVAQEIVVQLWRVRAQYDGERRLSTWVYRIALNVAISYYRRERRHAHHEPLVEIAADPDEPSDELAILHRCIAELGALDKALVLLYLDGHDHAAIAEVLGISLSNTATKLGRIKQKLRAAYQQGNQRHG